MHRDFRLDISGSIRLIPAAPGPVNLPVVCRRKPRALSFRNKGYQRLDPAVYTASFESADIFVYTQDEEEFIAIPPVSPTRLSLTAKEIELEHDEHEETMGIFDGADDA